MHTRGGDTEREAGELAGAAEGGAEHWSRDQPTFLPASVCLRDLGHTPFPLGASGLGPPGEVIIQHKGGEGRCA